MFTYTSTHINNCTKRITLYSLFLLANYYHAFLWFNQLGLNSKRNISSTHFPCLFSKKLWIKHKHAESSLSKFSPISYFIDPINPIWNQNIFFLFFPLKSQKEIKSILLLIILICFSMYSTFYCSTSWFKFIICTVIIFKFLGIFSTYRRFQDVCWASACRSICGESSTILCTDIWINSSNESSCCRTRPFSSN